MEKQLVLAIALAKQDKVDAAIKILEQALLKNKPTYRALSLLGTLYAKCFRLHEAEITLEKVVEFSDSTLSDKTNLGQVYNALGRVKDASNIYQSVLKIDPENVDANLGIGRIFFTFGRYDVALPFLTKVFDKTPGIPLLAGNIFEIKRRLLLWDDYDSLQNYIWTETVNGGAPAHPWSLFSTFDHPQMHLVAHSFHLKGMQRTHNVAPFKQQRAPNNKRIRIGYFSPDFRGHAVTTLILEMLEQHDRENFEIFAFYFPPAASRPNDPMTQAVENAVDEFYNTTDLLHSDFVELVRSKNLDIAVDLCGITTGHQVRLFVDRVARMQVSYLGYPGSLGSPIWDYIIADREVIPEHLMENYSERILWLDGCFQPNNSKRLVNRSKSRSDYGLPENAYVLCAFNDIYKVTPDALESWMKILRSLDHAILWIKIDFPVARKNLLRVATYYGVAHEKIVFAEKVADNSEHLGRYCLGDLFLDTYPYNGHTTASDALWAGLPVVTLRGTSNASRVCASILIHLGMPELVADSFDQYREIVYWLATNPKEADLIKGKVRACRDNTLFSGQAAARRIEMAFHRLHRLPDKASEWPKLLTVGVADGN